jgi:tetratricopeptide (TPR) repeat protein
VDRSLAIKKRAQQLVQKGQIDAALAEFERLFESGDKDPYDFILVADLLAKRGSMQEAVRRYRQAIQEYTSAELHKNAIAVCKKILRISKEDLQIHRALGDLYTKEGLYSDAQIHYLEFAEGSIRRQDYDAALDVIELVLKLSPDNVELSEKYVEISVRSDQPERGGRELLRRAVRFEDRGQSREAAELRDRASTLAPGLTTSQSDEDSVEADSPRDSFGSFQERPGGLSLESPGSEPSFVQDRSGTAFFEPSARIAEPGSIGLSASEELNSAFRAAEPREGSPEETWNAAETAFERGDLARSRSLLESLLERTPGHERALRRLIEITQQADDRPSESKARFELAEIYLGKSEWDLARAEYVRVLELDPRNERARMRVSRIEEMNGSATEGLVDLDALPHQRPSASVRVRDDQPTGIESLVDLEEIIDEFKAGVSHTISGEDHESHYDLGMAYMEMGLYDEAIQEFRVASEGGAMELKSLEMIALCYLEKNEPAMAASELTRALELPGHGPDQTISIRYNLGVAFERLGNLDKALQHFEEVHLLNVDFFKVGTKIREIKQRIAAARGS